MTTTTESTVSVLELHAQGLTAARERAAKSVAEFEAAQSSGNPNYRQLAYSLYSKLDIILYWLDTIEHDGGKLAAAAGAQ